MKLKHWLACGALLGGLLFAAPVPAQDDDAIIAEEADVEGVEVLTRGPIHEAFATPVTGELKATLVIPKEPPTDIDEVPPDFKPEGDDVAWISGYWSWDDEREDFIWISGVWRRTPPNQRWVAGYWDKVDEGWRWSSGFWAPLAEESITYYDPPPKTLEVGPSSDAPSDNHFWTPGVWVHYDTGYRWRGGYWAQSQPDWVWMPDRWVWTPSGAVFCPGYWDYAFASRGSVFSPVYINSTVYTQPGFAWRPRYTLNPAALMVNFWIRPNYCHYYFGNYYGGGYDRWGYTPMAQYYGRRGGWGYDPIIAYNQAHYRGRGINYVNRMNSWHDFYDKNPNRRPPATWRDQVNIVKNQKITVNKITNITNVNHIVNNDIDVIADNSTNIMALPVKQVARARRNDPDLRMAEVKESQGEWYRNQAKEMRKVSAERSKAEKKNAIAVADQPQRDDANKGQVRNKVKLPTVAQTRDDRPGGRDDRPGNDKPGNGKVGRDDGPDEKPIKPGVVDRPDRKPPSRPDARPDRNDDKPDPMPKRERPDPKAERPEPKTERPDPKPERPMPKPERPETKPERRPEPKIERPEPKPERPMPKPERPEVKPERRPEPKIERPEPKPERPMPKPERRPEPKVERPEPKPERPMPKPARPEPKPERKVEKPKVEPRPEPRRAEKPEVRQEPRPQPKPESRPRPNPQPRVESRPQPKPERPKPRVESRPQPKPEASRPPKNNGGGKPDNGGSGKGKD